MIRYRPYATAARQTRNATPAKAYPVRESRPRARHDDPHLERDRVSNLIG